MHPTDSTSKRMIRRTTKSGILEPEFLLTEALVLFADEEDVLSSLVTVVGDLDSEVTVGRDGD